MEIRKEETGAELVLNLVGRLDTTTAPELEAVAKESLEGKNKVTLDFTKLDYISSAGLRVLLAMQKTMNQQGKMVIQHVNPDILEVFEMTGFSDILTIE